MPGLATAHSNLRARRPRRRRRTSHRGHRTNRLALATSEVLARAKQIGSMTIAPEAPKRTPRQRSTAAKAPQPTFDDVEMRILDLSSSNEPVLVLTATARMPLSSGAAGSP